MGNCSNPEIKSNEVKNCNNTTLQNQKKGKEKQT